MIRVVVLGSGGSVPSVERGTSAVAVKHSGDVYLFDCGEGTQRQMMRFNVSYAKVKAVFITHLHADHFLGLPGLVETLTLIGRSEPLLVFGPRGTEERLTEFIHQPIAQIKDVDSDFAYTCDEFSVRPFNTMHYANSIGFVFEEKPKRKFNEKKAHEMGVRGRMFTEIQEKGELKVGRRTVKLGDISELKPGKKIVYTGDTMPCKETERASEGADLLIHDGTFGADMANESEAKRHTTARDAAKVAKSAGVKRLLITHISNRYDDDSVLEKEAKEVFQNSSVAKDGTEVIV